MAGVQWQEIEVPLGGVDRYTAAPHVLPGKLETARNVRFWSPPKAGKRYGHAPLGSGTFAGSFNTGRRLHGFEDETLLCTERSLWTYGYKASKWREAGPLGHANIRRAEVYHDQQYNLRDPDIASANDITVVCWPAPNLNTATAIVRDERTGAVVSVVQFGSPTTAASAWVRACAVGQYIYLFGQWAAGNVIHYTRIDTLSGNYTFPAPATLAVTATPVTSTVVPDVVAASATAFVIAYKDLATGQLRLDKIAISTHTVSNAYLSATALGTALALSGSDATGMYTCAFDNGTNLVIEEVNASLAAVAGPVTLAASVRATRVGSCSINSTHHLVAWENPGGSGIRPFTSWRTYRSGGALPGSQKNLADVVPTSKPFRARTSAASIHCWVAFESDKQATYYVAELTANTTEQDGRWVATAARGIASPAADINACWLSAVANIAGIPRTAQACKYQFRFASDDDETVVEARAGIYTLAADYTSPERFDAEPFGDILFLAGGRPSLYDGQSCSEHGFAWYPENWDAPFYTNPGGYLEGANAIPGHRYDCVLVYEWEDTRGNIQRSIPSEVIELELQGLGSNFTADIVLREALWNSRSLAGGYYPGSVTGVRIVPYRTVRATTAGTDPPQVYYRDSKHGFNAAYNQVIKVGAECNDANLILQDRLYITGDILDNAGTPPCSLVAAHADRLWLGGMEEPNRVWFSQPNFPGEAPRFNEALSLDVGDEVIAMASMDDKLIVFSTSAIYAITGNGPPATGGLDIGFEVSLVSSDTGTEQKKSVVLTPGGLMFVGRKGIYLLTRGLQLEYIGAPVKRLLDTYPTCTSALVEPSSTHVVFTVDNGDSAARLVYDYAIQQWTHDELDGIGVAMDAAVVYSPGEDAYRYALTLTSGLCYVEDHTRFDDASQPAPWQIVTPWLKLNTLQGYQRVRKALLLGDFSNCDGFTVEAGYDYDDTYATTYTFTSAELAALQRGQVMIDFEFQRCQAVRLRITETFTGEVYDHAGPQIQSIVVEAGFKPGPFRIQDAARH